MSKLWTLGIAGLLAAACGCVPSSQYVDMRQKYEDSQAENRRLKTANEELIAQNKMLASRAKGGRALTDDEIDEIMKRYGGPGGGGIKFPTIPDAKSLPEGGLELGDLTFRSGSVELSDKGRAALDGVAEYLKTQPPVRLVVKGHTDTDKISRSNHASNWELSGKRAAAVVDYLVKRGAATGENAELRGFGEFQPLSPDKAKNRRVEIYAYPAAGGESLKAPAAAPEELPKATEPAAPKTAPKVSPKDPTLK